LVVRRGVREGRRGEGKEGRGRSARTLAKAYRYPRLVLSARLVLCLMKNGGRGGRREVWNEGKGVCVRMCERTMMMRKGCVSEVE